MKQISLILILSTFCISVSAKEQVLTLNSPDGKVSAEITTGEGPMTYSVNYDGQVLLAASEIGLKLSDGYIVGANAGTSSLKRKSVDTMIASPLYRSDSIADVYNQLSFKLGKGWSMEFRAYNNGIAYRYIYSNKKPVTIAEEIAEYVFPNGGVGTVPFVNHKNYDVFETQFFNSFENIYTTAPLDSLDSRRLAFLPLTVAPTGASAKLLFNESNLLNYPGMYLVAAGDTLKAVFAPYPKRIEQGGYINLQGVVKEREEYIAHLDGPEALPWRITGVAPTDADLARTELAYQLAEPSRIDDISWIKPGKVAWDWWNAWNLIDVDFKAGINNKTYKAYIDFAANNGIEYVILDDGWSETGASDLFKVVPEINLPELIEYGNQRGVGLILWAGYTSFMRDIEAVCKHYSDMGIKGFKVDFLDRDDQIMTKDRARMAEVAAKYGLVLDIHGTFKMAGLNRTYPNVLNVEGVHGLETMKWMPNGHDQVTYDVEIPFIRQAGGPMDYTQGAMLNATEKNYRPIHSEPMSQGTRCRQLALYMVLDSPLNMLCDSPSNYNREVECTRFISQVPTVWDETVIIDGVVGDYIITARRSGDTWYVGGLTDWTPRTLPLELSFLAPGTKYEAEIFEDGKNADRNARDYSLRHKTVVSTDAISMTLAPGGGFAIKLTPEK